ncbi:MAG: hypothetical protein H7320_20915 [Ferruginibacter sp.]|nr:hypothetical protein [Ferruginibacter sp.]
MNKLLVNFFIAASLICLQVHAQPTSIKVNDVANPRQLTMPWRNCIAVGRANNLLRADLLEHLAYAQKELSYRYCRFHAIFDDEMNVVQRDKQTNQLIFNWHQVDKVYDALLKLGIRPFVELNPMPAVMASGTQTMFNYKMNVTPPKSYQEWELLVETFTRHLVERYGLDEVRTWYFEVWNEPNLGGFWSGTQQEYWNLYTASATAIKKVDTKLRVGGPASSKGNWIKEIITYTTKNKIPLDFVSTHLYPQDEQVQYPDRKGSPYKVGDFFSATVKEVQEWVKKSERPDIEIHWTEWNTQTAATADKITWGDNIYVDNLYAASFIARNCIELDTACKTFAYWVVSDIFDEGGIPQSPFSCTYGLLSIHGIPKASFNAFRFLRKMTGNIMEAKLQKPLPNGKGLLVTKENQTIKVLMWNQYFAEEKTQTDWAGTIELPIEKDTAANVVKANIGIGAGSPWESWQLMGSPLNPSPAQLDLLKQHAQPAYSFYKLQVKKNVANLSFKLLPGEVQYFEITLPRPSVNTKFANPEEFKLWDKLIGEKSN